jgi:serine/threonine protein kinase
LAAAYGRRRYDQEAERKYFSMQDDGLSLGGEATFAGRAQRPRADASLGDERTLGGGDAAAIDTVFDDIEVIDLAGRYKTEGTLGRGGMGEVLLALDTRLDRKVAIKRILGEAARSKTAVSRFLTEAKAIAALNHPNVVQIYDYGRASDGPFLIMEYVDGNSLLDRCRDGALPLEQAVDLACQLCDGLAKAHDLGIVHRDIKPANVLLTKDGLPKLTDFGLAKAEAADHQMTMTGAVLGTPDFMPPEQRKDAALVDHRSDLWSLAATLYQMVTGRSPKIIRFDLLPPGLTSVLGKALEDSKDDRYQSAREFRDALKTSLAAAAPAAAELGEGQCPACGVKNDSSRRFCRGCGEALEAPCLSCSKPMPMWEHICGQCGTKQAPLLENRRGEMAARQAEAEGLLNDYDFDQAERLTIALRDESDPRLKHLQPWAITFLPQVEEARKEQVERADALLREALRHEQAFDYQSGLHSLAQIPEILRTSVVGDDGDSPAQVLDRLSGKQSQCISLEKKIKAAIASRQFGGLLPDVDTFLKLRPDRQDLLKLKSQLLERDHKLKQQRDQLFSEASKLYEMQDYGEAISALKKVDAAVSAPEVEFLLQQAESAHGRVVSLFATIKAALAEKRYDGLLAIVNDLLELKAGDEEVGKLRQSLLDRDQKIRSEVDGVVKQATTLWRKCRFAEATAALEKIASQRRTQEAARLLDSCADMEQARRAVFAAIAESDAPAFSFEAIDAASGKEIRGSVVADNETDAKAQIVAMGYMMTRLKPRKAGESVDEGRIVPALEKYRSLLDLANLEDPEFRAVVRPVEEAIAKQRQAVQEADARALQRKAMRATMTNAIVLVAVTAGCAWAVAIFARERFDATSDAVILKWLPIAALSCAWLWFVRGQLRRRSTQG